MQYTGKGGIDYDEFRTLLTITTNEEHERMASRPPEAELRRLKQQFVNKIDELVSRVRQWEYSQPKLAEAIPPPNAMTDTVPMPKIIDDRSTEVLEKVPANVDVNNVGMDIFDQEPPF
jgi:hypothetical protein